MMWLSYVPTALHSQKRCNTTLLIRQIAANPMIYMDTPKLFTLFIIDSLNDTSQQ